MDVPPGLEQLEPDLAAGLPASDDQHAAVELIGVAVRRRVHLNHTRRNRWRRGVGQGLLERARRDDDAAGDERVVDQLELELSAA
jgi:hypothetical protein